MKLQFVLLLCLAIFVPTAHAQQKAREVTKGADDWSFDVRWKDANGKKRRVEFELPTTAVEHDLEVPLQFQKRKANVQIAKAINAYGKTLKGVKLQAQATSGGVRISGQGSRKKLKKAAKGAKDVQKKELRKYMKKNGFTKLRGKIIPNHAQHAYRYSDDVEPLATALGAEQLGRRQFAVKALSFVQTIPYEKGKGGRDKGFRPPLSLLAKNKGDCDSKATLYLALLKAAHPSLDTSFIYINGHAFVGLGLKPKSGDMTFQADGRKWVIAEPVGPALYKLGDADKQSKRKARRGKIGIRRVKDD
jgi:hypothetical protein